jgi:hypothetical protein
MTPPTIYRLAQSKLKLKFLWQEVRASRILGGQSSLDVAGYSLSDMEPLSTKSVNLESLCGYYLLQLNLFSNSVEARAVNKASQKQKGCHNNAEAQKILSVVIHFSKQDKQLIFDVMQGFIIQWKRHLFLE